MKVIFCAYRDWAVNVCLDLSKTLSDHRFHIVREPKMLEQVVHTEHWDVVVLVGWSWKVGPDIINNHLVVGMHPSDLPDYAGGSPIQNQILDGLAMTRATLFKLNVNFDEGDIIAKETYSLEGHLKDVLNSLTSATVTLLTNFIVSYPDFTLTPQKSLGTGFVRRRLKPEHSRLMADDFDKMTCKQLWDFIRCRENPYPNAYIEDETGTLYFKTVEFNKKGT